MPIHIHIFYFNPLQFQANRWGRQSRIHNITVRKYPENITNLHTISPKQVTPWFIVILSNWWRYFTHRNLIIGTTYLLYYTTLMMSWRNLKGGFLSSFSVNGGFFMYFPRVSCVRFTTSGRISSLISDYTTKHISRHNLKSNYTRLESNLATKHS